jgi:hypothetical protein
LDAVAIAYGQIAQLVHDAHQQLGGNAQRAETGKVFTAHRGEPGKLPHCMIGHEDVRCINISLADGSAWTLSAEPVRTSRQAAEQALERYGRNPEQIFGPARDPEELLHGIFDSARALFEKDGYHVWLAFLLKGKTVVYFMQLSARNQADKYIVMRQVGQEVLRRGADGVVEVGEVWMAKSDPKSRYKFAVDSQDRMEALTATLVTRDGDPIQLSARITRDGDRITLASTEVLSRGFPMMFAPVYEAWGRPIPSDWLNR